MYLKEQQDYSNTKYLMMYRTTPDSYFLHWHNEVELMYVISGSVRYGVNQQILTLETGDFIIVNIGDIHWLCSNDEHCDVYIMVINTEPLQKLIDIAKLHTAVFRGAAFSQNNDFKKLLPLMDLIYEEYHNCSIYQEELLRKMLQILFLYCFRCYPDAQFLALPNRMIKEAGLCKKILEFFHETDPIDLTLTNLADFLGYSANYVCKVFKKIFNRSFYQYVLEYRVSIAKKLLTTTAMPVTKIASQSGFSSERAFNISFKKATLETPGAYRKNYERKLQGSCLTT